MNQRLFGDTPEAEIRYLQPRLLLTGPFLIIGFIVLLAGGNPGAVFALAAYVWAWTFLKNWFGITTIGALFSNNLVVGIILFVVYLVIGYLIGLVAFVFGLFRYIMLKLVYKY